MKSFCHVYEREPIPFLGAVYRSKAVPPLHTMPRPSDARTPCAPRIKHVAPNGMCSPYPALRPTASAAVADITSVEAEIEKLEKAFPSTSMRAHVHNCASLHAGAEHIKLHVKMYFEFFPAVASRRPSCMPRSMPIDFQDLLSAKKDDALQSQERPTYACALHASC